MTKPPATFAGLEDLLDLGWDWIDTRATLLRVLTDLYLQRVTHTPEEEHYYTELALRLIDAADVSERAALARRLAAYPSAPAPVVTRLARDVIEVAGPILDALALHHRRRPRGDRRGARQRPCADHCGAGARPPAGRAARRWRQHRQGGGFRTVGTVLRRRSAGTPADPDQSRLRLARPVAARLRPATRRHAATGSGGAPAQCRDADPRARAHARPLARPRAPDGQRRAGRTDGGRRQGAALAGRRAAAHAAVHESMGRAVGRSHLSALRAPRRNQRGRGAPADRDLARRRRDGGQPNPARTGRLADGCGQRAARAVRGHAPPGARAGEARAQRRGGERGADLV